MIDVTLPIDLVSANKLLRMHYQARKRLRVDYRERLFEHGIRRKNPPEGRQLVRITRVLGPGQREFDTDNLHGSVKELLDSLRDFRIVRDDTPSAIELVVEQDAQRRGGGPAVRVRVERFAGET